MLCQVASMDKAKRRSMRDAVGQHLIQRANCIMVQVKTTFEERSFGLLTPYNKSSFIYEPLQLYLHKDLH